MNRHVEGFIRVAETNRKTEALKPEKEQKAWRRLVDNWAKALPKNDRTAAKATLYAFFEWWGGLPSKQRNRPWEFQRLHD